jgi:hypothetical protein
VLRASDATGIGIDDDDDDNNNDNNNNDNNNDDDGNGTHKESICKGTAPTSSAL